MKKYIFGVAGLFIIASGYIAYGKILQRGCEQAIFRNLTDQYGQPPAELKDKAKENIASVCQQLLN
jgi:hypothetical protein